MIEVGKHDNKASVPRSKCVLDRDLNVIEGDKRYGPENLINMALFRRWSPYLFRQ